MSQTTYQSPQAANAHAQGAQTTFPNEAARYVARVTELSGQFSTKIGTLASTYVNHKLFPTNTEYQNVHTRNLSAVNKIKSDLFELQNEVDGATEVVRDSNNALSDNIKAERTLEDDVIHDFERAEDGGSAGARKVLTDMYKLQYASNFFMVVGVLLVMFAMSFIFSQSQGGEGSGSGSIADIVPSVEVTP